MSGFQNQNVFLHICENIEFAQEKEKSFSIVFTGYLAAQSM